MQMRELARAGECEGNRALELHEPERFQQIRHRRKGASVLARRQDARTDDREVLEPAPEPGCRCQAGRRGRLEDHHRGRFVVGQLAVADRFVTGPPDDRLEQDPEIRMRLADQNSGHVTSVGDRSMEAVVALV